MVTVARTFTRLVDEDFGWKDPKAAERTGMSMVDLRDRRQDRGFKAKTVFIRFTGEAAGLSPGITSAFRDDYRSRCKGPQGGEQQVVSWRSSRGGYGHGLAADIVSVQGGNARPAMGFLRKLWKWVDAHGRNSESGAHISAGPAACRTGRGREYAAHNRGLQAGGAEVKKVKRVAIRMTRISRSARELQQPPKIERAERPVPI